MIINDLLPEIIKSKAGAKHLRIWSAACSSGEEPYTLAMLLKSRRPDVTFVIMATDICKQGVESAKRGGYSSYSDRNVEEPYMQKHFTHQGESYHLSEEIKNSVRFSQHNMLASFRPPELNNLDIVLCRNVLIYFDNKTKQDAVSTAYDSLSSGGYLVIGSSESLHNVTRAFKPRTIGKVVAYGKL